MMTKQASGSFEKARLGEGSCRFEREGTEDDGATKRYHLLSSFGEALDWMVISHENPRGIARGVIIS